MGYVRGMETPARNRLIVAAVVLVVAALNPERGTVWVNTAATGGQIKLRIREYNGANLVGTGTATLNGPTADWQQMTLSYTVLSPGSTLDLNVYETTQAAGSDLLVDDVTLKSG